MYRHVPIWQHNASPISMNDLYSIFCQNALSIYVYPWGMHCRVVYDSGVTPVRPSEGAVVMPGTYYDVPCVPMGRGCHPCALLN